MPVFPPPKVAKLILGTNLENPAYFSTFFLDFIYRYDNFTADRVALELNEIQSKFNFEDPFDVVVLRQETVDKIKCDLDWFQVCIPYGDYYILGALVESKGSDFFRTFVGIQNVPIYNSAFQFYPASKTKKDITRDRYNLLYPSSGKTFIKQLFKSKGGIKVLTALTCLDSNFIAPNQFVYGLEEIDNVRCVYIQNRQYNCSDDFWSKYVCPQCYGIHNKCKDCGICSFCCKCVKCVCGKKKFITKKHTPKITAATISCNICGKCTLHECKCKYPRQLPDMTQKNYVGIEYEFGVGVHSDDFRQFGRTMTDISCPGQFEVCTPPRKLGKTLNTLKNIVDKVKQQGIRQTNDCGYHVHVNAVDFNMYDYRTLWLLWTRFERDILEKYVNRDLNKYCFALTSFAEEEAFTNLLLTLTNSRDIRKAFLWYYGSSIPISTIKTYLVMDSGIASNSRTRRAYKTVRSCFREKYGSNALRNISPADQQVELAENASLRYTTLNLHSLMYRGTVEFRAKEASDDFEDLKRWTEFCYRFTRVSERLSLTTAINLFDLEDLEHTMTKIAL